MKLKESRFTFKTDDGNGGLLLYNSMVGVESLLHIPSYAVNAYELTFSNEFDLGNSSSVQKLLDTGIVVPADKNEDFELKQKYIDVLSEDTLTIIINPTEKCNFKCKYCYETFENGRMSDETVQGIIKFVETNIKRFRRLNVMWFGGEPLLEVGVIEKLSEAFMAICKRYGKMYMADITSNGYLLDYNVFERLMKNKVIAYQITVDGCRDTHDQQRIGVDGKPTFDIIVENIKTILSNTKYRHFILTIRVNVSKKIYDSLDKLIVEYNELFGRDHRVFIDFHLVGNWLGKTEKNFTCQLLGQSELREVYKKILDNPIPLHNISHAFLNPGGRVCYSGKPNSIMFSSDGTIHKCTLLFNSPNSKLGKITNEGIFEGFQSYRAQKWLCNDDNCKYLKDCYYAPICFGDSCPSAHSGLFNSEEAIITGCPPEKGNLDLLLKILYRSRPFKKWGGSKIG